MRQHHPGGRQAGRHLPHVPLTYGVHGGRDMDQEIIFEIVVEDVQEEDVDLED